jgi:3-hydroxyacyl-[acyl-carrier-protein] dehydratase
MHHDERVDMTTAADIQDGNVVRLTPGQIREILPQKEPFLFINGPAEVVPGVWVHTTATYAENSFFYAGHFPGFPLTPGVIIVETMAQAASLIILTMPEHVGQIGYFVGIKNARFFKSVFPGSTIELDGRFVGVCHGVIESTVEARRDGVRVARADLTCTFRAQRALTDTDRRSSPMADVQGM